MSTHYQTQKEWLVANRAQLIEQYRQFVADTGIHVRFKDWASDEWDKLRNKNVD